MHALFGSEVQTEFKARRTANAPVNERRIAYKVALPDEAELQAWHVSSPDQTGIHVLTLSYSGRDPR
jgi:hypothetical protein